MTSTLKMIFNLDNGKTTILSLAAPRTDLVADEVKAFATEVVDNAAILVDGAKATALKKAYIQDVEEKEIVPEA